MFSWFFAGLLVLLSAVGGLMVYDPAYLNSTPVGESGVRSVGIILIALSFVFTKLAVEIAHDHHKEQQKNVLINRQK